MTCQSGRCSSSAVSSADRDSRSVSRRCRRISSSRWSSSINTNCSSGGEARPTAAITAAIDVPLNVDAERGFADNPAGVAQTISLIADTGAAGCSIEDYDPARKALDPVEAAVERVGAAAESAHSFGLVLTARAENHLYGMDDLDDTIARLRAYQAAGADVVYAPGLSRLSHIEQVVRAVATPVNVLLLPGGPSVAELAAVGVRRVSTGGALAWAAYGALRTAATELRDAGTSTYASRALSADERAQIFEA
jgi:2-methylisocitrate lyase-like PEP mutase family enzyme